MVPGSVVATGWPQRQQPEARPGSPPLLILACCQWQNLPNAGPRSTCDNGAKVSCGYTSVYPGADGRRPSAAWSPTLPKAILGPWPRGSVRQRGPEGQYRLEGPKWPRGGGVERDVFEGTNGPRGRARVGREGRWPTLQTWWPLLLRRARWSSTLRPARSDTKLFRLEQRGIDRLRNRRHCGRRADRCGHVQPRRRSRKRPEQGDHHRARRRGPVRGPSLAAKRGGVYWRNGGINWRALVALGLGLFAAMTWIDAAFYSPAYSSFFSNRTHGADFSWLFGLVVGAVVYYLLSVSSVRKEALARPSPVTKEPVKA
jgi:hypothetical protein